MAILTKAQLEALNQSSFPDQSTEAITPAILRTYNTATIDTLVDSLDTGSFITNTTALNAFTASQLSINSGLNASTASQQISINNLNSNTASVDSSITILTAASASFEAKFETIGTQSGSWGSGGSVPAGTVSGSAQIVALGFLQTSSFNSYTSSTDSSISQLNASSASQQISINNLNSTTASLNSSITNLNSTTASINSSITQLNASSASQQISINNLNAATSSYITTPLTSLNAYTASNDTKWASLGAQSGSWITESETGSFVTSAITASSLVTASVAGADITFTKGDGSSFTITTATGSVASASYAENAATASIARNVIIVARNGNASTLPAGTVVRITSAVGDNPIFNTASYDDEANSSNTLGILRYSTATGVDSEVVVQGTVLGVNTDPGLGYAAGDILYLSSSGQFTNVQPQAPLQTVTLGEVLRVQQNNGSIYVNVSNGWELNELHNVQITSPTTGQLLAYESASYGLWKNKSASTLGLATTGSNIFIGDQTITGSFSTNAGITVGNTSAQYNSVNIVTSKTNYPGNVYNAFNINTDGDGQWSAGMYVSSYNGFGSEPAAGLYGGGLGNAGTNNILESYGNLVRINKNTQLSGSLEVSASLSVNGSPVVVSSQTGSFIVNTGSFATTGSNSFLGNQTITGSLLISSSATNDLIVSGNMVIGGLSFPTITLSGSTGVGQTTMGATAFSFTSGSPALGTTNGMTAVLGKQISSTYIPTGGYIGISGNPAQIGAASLSSATLPSILAQAPGTGQFYPVITLQPSASYTDGRVTLPRNVAMLQNLEITGSLTASLAQGYVWVGDANNKTTLVATSSFAGGGGSVPAGTVSGSAQILAYNIFATTGSNNFVGTQTISENAVTALSVSSNNKAIDVTTGSIETNGSMFFNNPPYYAGTSNNRGQFGMVNVSEFQQKFWDNNQSGSYVSWQHNTGSLKSSVDLIAKYNGVEGGITVQNLNGSTSCIINVNDSAEIKGNIKFEKGTDKATGVVSVGSGGATVTNSLVTTNSIVLLTTQNNSVTSTVYPATVGTISAGSFTISHNFSGNLNVAYLIINPAP